MTKPVDIRSRRPGTFCAIEDGRVRMNIRFQEPLDLGDYVLPDVATTYSPRKAKEVGRELIRLALEIEQEQRRKRRNQGC